MKFVKADKGNEIVVIDESEYKEKIQQHLSNTGTYQEVNRNPIKTLVSKVNRELLELKKLKEISYEEYHWMRCNKEVIPKFYAAIKTHKENYPIRPICAFNDSPTYHLAKFLSKSLMPLTERAEQKLKNSY